MRRVGQSTSSKPAITDCLLWLQHGSRGRARRGGRYSGRDRSGGFARRPARPGKRRRNKSTSPILLVVGAKDDIVIRLNEQARDKVHCELKLEIIPGATHLFEEPGAPEKVARLASD
jgi:pimeloyl-ACP methyl ester carboxylesterase